MAIINRIADFHDDMIAWRHEFEARVEWRGPGEVVHHAAGR